MKQYSISNPVEKLFKAIDKEDNEKILALIVYRREILRAVNRNGLTPLMDAVIGKKYDAMRLLLLHGADANQRDQDGWTAKSWAMFIQDKEAQKILSKASVLCNTDDISGMVWGSMGI
jgi:ankyrin repeat protein